MNPDDLTLVPNRAQRDGLVAWEMLRSGRSAVMPNDLAVWSDWMTRGLRQACLMAGDAWLAPADRWQEAEAWRGVLREALPSMAPHDLGRLVRQCRQADRLVAQWSETVNAADGGSLWRGFLDWRGRTREVLAAAGLVPGCELPARFAALLTTSGLPDRRMPARIRMQGFTEITRSERQVLNTIEALGVRVQMIQPAAPTQTVRPTAFSNESSEMAAAAEWATAQLAGGARRVAIVLPGLAADRARLARAFLNRIDPASVLGLSDSAASQVHLGEPACLAGHPLVRSAFGLLELSLAGHRAPHELERISQWLRSPGWRGANQERAARGRLDRWLREKGWYRLSLAEVLEAARTPRFRSSVPELVACIEGLDAPLGPLPVMRRFAEWLEGWGWGNDEGCNQASDAVVARFGSLLERFSAWHGLGAQRGLALLREACADPSWSDVGGALSPVQVLSPEVAMGQSFDGLWLGRMTEEHFPAPPVTNALLPSAIREAIPRSDDTGALDYAHRLTRGLLSVAPEVRVSWHRTAGDAPRFISPVFNGAAGESVEERNDGALWRAAYPGLPSLSTRRHPWLCARPLGAGRPLAGGATVKRMVELMNVQSGCPLAAYFGWRLAARPLPSPEPFLTPADSGNLVHEVLFRLYDDTGTARPLKDLPGLIDKVLDLHPLIRRLPPLVRNTEAERLQQLVPEWLAFEAASWPWRPERAETEGRFEWEGLRFQLRPDRVDRVSKDEVFIIDYKTGAGTTSVDWAQARPGNLQLPLYATLLTEQGRDRAIGLALAQVRRAEMKWVGFAGDQRFAGAGIAQPGRGPSAVSRAFTDWESCLGAWRDALRKLAREFRDGDCRHQLYHEAALAWTGLELPLRNAQLTRWAVEKGAPP